MSQRLFRQRYISVSSLSRLSSRSNTTFLIFTTILTKMQVTHITKSNANKINHPKPNIFESNATKTIVMMHKPANVKRLPIPRFVTFFSTLLKFISAILILSIYIPHTSHRPYYISYNICNFCKLCNSCFLHKSTRVPYSE